ncbi:unnamed protein product [Cylicocyclus nassatus]|uniref:Uncharacterized protein n=1 Tax=Cylicocyclus nassatus TaxID=53992 RepID=A0AA36H1U6_CYLNA|nr:unnamed protein product [Cylicocyclus nassatus]
MRRTALCVQRQPKPVKDVPFKRVMPVHKAQPQKRTFTDKVRSEETYIPHLVKIDGEDELYGEDFTHELSFARTDLRMENATEEVNLYQCVCNGALDLNKAARLILRQKNNGTFNQQVYDVDTSWYR